MARISIALAAALAVLVMAFVFVRSGSSGHEGRYVSEHAQAVPQAERTISISRTSPAPSTDPTHLSALLVSGRMPTHATKGQVLTDTDCAPDRHMISHCRNEVRLPDGTTIVLRHPHDMSRIPCLAPHEQVVLRPATA
jgi:hypothetical protein